jgi:copper oxidase (laccase) domain-containing protein
VRDDSAGAGDWGKDCRRGLGKWHLDLKRSCQLQLEAAGLDPARLEVAAECTCCHKELFFSYRRDNGKTGRQIGFIKMGI